MERLCVYRLILWALVLYAAACIVVDALTLWRGDLVMIVYLVTDTALGPACAVALMCSMFVGCAPVPRNYVKLEEGPSPDTQAADSDAECKRREFFGTVAGVLLIMYSTWQLVGGILVRPTGALHVLRICLAMAPVGLFCVAGVGSVLFWVLSWCLPLALEYVPAAMTTEGCADMWRAACCPTSRSEAIN